MVLLLGCVTLELTSCHEKLYSSFDKINFIQDFCKVLLLADLWKLSDLLKIELSRLFWGLLHFLEI